MKRKKSHTIQTIPLDLILNVGKFLEPTSSSSSTDINKVTLAAVLNNKDMLEQLMDTSEKGDISPSVALSGNLRILQWLIQRKKYPMNEDTCTAAAEGGHLHVLQYLHNHGCFLDQGTCEAAAKNGHLDILEWLHENHKIFVPSLCFVMAASKGNLDVLQWLYETYDNRDEILSMDAFDGAVDNNNKEVVQWLYDIDCPSYETWLRSDICHQNGWSWDSDEEDEIMDESQRDMYLDYMLEMKDYADE